MSEVTGKTIVYLPNWLGDMVMATPFLNSLRTSLDGELWGIGKPKAMGIYNGLNIFNRFIPFENRGIVSFLDTVSLIKGLQFERAIALPHSMRSALLFFLAGIRHRIGYVRNKRGFMLTKKIQDKGKPASTVEHYLKIIDAIGGIRSFKNPLLTITTDEEKRFDEQYIDIHKPFIAFIVGAQYGPSKRWPSSHFSILADMIAQKLNYRIYILPGKNEENLAREVKEGASKKDYIDIKSFDISDLKVCLSRASAVVSNDTGPRHISAALLVPTVVLFGPMDEIYTDYQSNNTYKISKDIPCKPCNNKRCDKNLECLTQIKPEEVYDKLEEIIGTTDG